MGWTHDFAMGKKKEIVLIEVKSGKVTSKT
jgi:hypothetical protein